MVTHLLFSIGITLAIVLINWYLVKQTVRKISSCYFLIFLVSTVLLITLKFLNGIILAEGILSVVAIYFCIWKKVKQHAPEKLQIGDMPYDEKASFEKEWQQATAFNKLQIEEKAKQMQYRAWVAIYALLTIVAFCVAELTSCFILKS